MMDVAGLVVTRPAGHPGVLLVTIDRPPVNALSLALFKGLRDLFQGVGALTDIRCVVLTAAGRMFSAGADVKELSERTTEVQIARSVISRGCFDAIRRCDVPVIAAVNGAALGAGLVVASSCDLMVASDSAVFSLPEINVGVMGGTRHTARLLPDKLVRYLALTGRKIDARTLQSYGGVNEVVAPESLMTAAFDIADEIARKSPAAIRLMKESINLTEDMPVTEGYRVEQLFTTLASSMDESKEASAAFLEKRDPRWVTDLGK
ncbi:enoyl-CoA hydratase [Rhizobium sp. CRIBSB]|nr:enoyl-CoA hydratase [Rhizobium sp. CRIBSB]